MLKYFELIEQTFDFPTEEFKVVNNELHFCGVPLMDIVAEYGTPLRLTYLPRISEKIQMAKKLFNDAIKKYDYQGQYHYCYCTKSSHFKHVLVEALKNDINLETSSAYDVPIIRELYNEGLINKDIHIICNGYKRENYQREIVDLINDGFVNCTPILDTVDEIDYYEKHLKVPCTIGIRVASDEEPDSSFYTSRLGIRYNDVLSVYRNRIKNNPLFNLKALHFFVDTGIRDTAYYWNELAKFIDKYIELRKICPELDSVDIGGGLPIKTSLNFEFDYEYIINEIIDNVKELCHEEGVPEPHIFSEFGSFTVGESGAMVYKILENKFQNDKEIWYMIDGSFITHLPDTWALDQKFILLSVNHWDKRYQRVNMGGLTCDKMDYYNSEAHRSEVFLPKVGRDEDLYVGFFHTGAYQDALGGYGGISHCLVPSPQHVLLDRDSDGKLTHKLFSAHQSHQSMLKLLGY